MVKKCCTCKKYKKLEDYSKDKSRKDGLRNQCKDCVKEYRQNNKEKFKEYHKTYFSNNKEKISKKSKKNYLNNKEKINNRSKERRQKQIQNNICIYCTKEALQYSQLCEYHWVKRIVDTKKIKEVLTLEERHLLVIQLLEKLKDNNYICFYTGIQLIPGKNASIDHVIPKSNFTNKKEAHNITNLVWVDLKVNKIKDDKSLEDFKEELNSFVTQVFYNIQEGTCSL